MGRQGELRCHPPRGRPDAEVVSWLRNGVPIDTSTDSNFIISSSGSLLILQAKLSDTANYSCVAANVARQRTSPAALVTVFSKYLQYLDRDHQDWPGRVIISCQHNTGPLSALRPHLAHGSLGVTVRRDMSQCHPHSSQSRFIVML